MKDYVRKTYCIVLTFLICWPQKGFFHFQYPSVFWTPKNCRFNLNKQQGKDNGYQFKVKPYGKIYFVCPNIALWSDMSVTGLQLSMMYENMYLVDKHGYDTCTVNKSKDRQILRCGSGATQLKYFEETFSPVRADPTQMSYKGNKTYYFISTSNGRKGSLDNLSGGHCKTHRMKLKITVCDMDDPCLFELPKCPYTYVFDAKYKTTTTTPTTTTSSTLVQAERSTSLKEDDESKLNTRLYPTESFKGETSTSGKEATVYIDVHTLPTTEKRSEAKPAKLSSNGSIWGTQRTHIIIHIAMALLILVLTLSLIYTLITGRKRKSPSPQGFASKLYQERPTSVIPLSESSNGDVNV